MARTTLKTALMAAFLGALVMSALAAEEGVAEAALIADGAGGASSTLPLPVRGLRLRHQDSWTAELCFGAAIVLYLINIFVGRARNKRLAVAYTAQLVEDRGVLDSNFALLGPGDTQPGEVLIQESASCFKFWASGRRYCQGLLATFRLVRRQDLLAVAQALIWGERDMLDIEIHMSAGAMPPMVLAVAVPRLARDMERDVDDLSLLTKRLDVGPRQLPGWPQEKLVVLAEHSSLFYGIMTPQIMNAAFGPEAFALVRPYFRSLHISSELPEGGPRQAIKLTFALPPPRDLEALDRLLTLCMLLVDAVGCFKLTPDQQKHAAEVRKRREASNKAVEEERQKALEEKKEQKAKEEQERLRRMAPEQRAKELERKARVQKKRQMSKFVKVK